MDSKRFNIYAGSILGGFLLFLLLNFFSSLLYFGPEHAGHEEEVLAFAIPVETEGEAEEPEEVNLAALAAEADPSDGERVFNKCKACHAAEEGKHGVGPALHDIVGADIAAAQGFAYSDALTQLEGEWGLENLSAFLENPSGYAPGTKMAFAGLADPEDRVDVIAYLNQIGGTPVELVSEEMAAAEQPAAEEPAEAEQPTEPAAADEPAGEPAQEGEQRGDAEGQEAQQQAETQEAEQQAQAQQEQAEQTQEPAQEEQAAGAGPFADLLAQASAEEGEKVYRRCQACHVLEEGKHRVGPSLYGVIGADIGSTEGYNYSDAMREAEGDWTLEKLMAYLEDPRGNMPGTKMSFAGLDDAQDRINVLTYIDESDGERDLPQ